jgi:polar amino acid transport system permease protein
MANDVAVSTQRVFETWITTSAIYFAVCFALSRLFSRWEVRAR